MKHWWLFLLFALTPLLAASGLPGQTLQPVPALTGRVVDLTATLGRDAFDTLNQRLTQLESEKGAQLVVLLVGTTAPEDIAAYANRVADTWKIGRQGVGDGVLLLVAKEDRAVRIEVARALEGAVPDLAARRVIDEAIVARFRVGHFEAGLLEAVSQLDALIRHEPRPAMEADSAYGDAARGKFSITVMIASFLLLLVFSLGGPVVGVGALVVLDGAGAIAAIAGYQLGNGWVSARSAYLWSLAGGCVLLLAFAVAWIRKDKSALGVGDSNPSRRQEPTQDPIEETRVQTGYSPAESSFISGGGGSFGGGGASGKW